MVFFYELNYMHADEVAVLRRLGFQLQAVPDNVCPLESLSVEMIE
jgi:hypothetical protein